MAGLLLLAAASGGPAREGDRYDAAGIVTSDAQPYLLENEAAMTWMMQAMAVQPSDDLKRDFVAMMPAHHQGAIDMATALLRHGGNEQLHYLAQEVIVTQQD